MTRIKSEHPVAPAVRKRIEESLDAIEKRFNVRILFACESGSRGWGFASPDSDYDVRFLYLPSLAWYLRVMPQRDVIEVPISDELDISGWELRKALSLLRKSNPILLEWLDSPIVYRQDEVVMSRFRELAGRFFSTQRGRYHYLSMAKRNFREHLKGETVRYKKYLYVLRPLLAVQWIDAGLGAPPMRFADLVAGTVEDAATRDEINTLLELKMQVAESEYGSRRPRIHALIEERLRAVDKAGGETSDVGADDDALDRFLLETVTGVAD